MVGDEAQAAGSDKVVCYRHESMLLLMRSSRCRHRRRAVVLCACCAHVYNTVKSPPDRALPLVAAATWRHTLPDGYSTHLLEAAATVLPLPLLRLLLLARPPPAAEQLPQPSSYRLVGVQRVALPQRVHLPLLRLQCLLQAGHLHKGARQQCSNEEGAYGYALQPLGDLHSSLQQLARQ